MAGIGDSSEELIPKVHPGQDRDPHHCGVPRFCYRAKAKAQMAETPEMPSRTGKASGGPGCDSLRELP